MMGMRTMRRREALTGYLMTAPVALGILGFYFLPSLYAIALSFTSGSDFLKRVYAGLDNYKALFQMEDFYYELGNTFYFAIASVVLSMAASLFFANLLSKQIRFRSAFRVVYFLPVLTMPVAVAVVWRYLFNSQYGLINQVLGALKLFEPKWLTDPSIMMLAVIIVSVWSNIGYNLMILLAGIKNISRTYYEAADIDGASESRKFFAITLPLLSPTIFFLLTMSTIGAFKVFDLVYMFAGGGAFTNNVFLKYYRTLAFGIYQQGFVFQKMGLATAESTVLLVIIMGLTLLQFRIQNKWVHYE